MNAPSLRTGERVVHESRLLIDTPFVLRGRVPGVALDCMGVVVLSHRAAGLEVTDPLNYRAMAVQSPQDVTAYRRCFRRVRREDARPGDMALIEAGDQAHQAIIVEVGEDGGLLLIQADDRAAIDRVVLDPLCEEMRIRAIFRHRCLP